jgi:hypothetical protein
MVTSDSIKIAEIPSRIWNFNHYFQLPVDRSGITVKEYLSQRNIVWRFGDDPSADFRVYKEENLRNGLLSFRRLKNEFQKRIEKKPYINLNGEAQENSKISYLLADPDRTFSVAPGDKFKRLYFPSLWSDPQIEHWEERSDRICWIGRPLPDRIRLAKKINKLGIGLDIYSREPWPLENWKGPIADESDISQKYRYRVVFENSLKNLYHSEKLFNSVRSGCVTFYRADPSLRLPELTDSYLLCNEKDLLERQNAAENVIKKIHNLMFSDKWEIYSFKTFFGNIIEKALMNKNTDNPG